MFVRHPTGQLSADRVSVETGTSTRRHPADRPHRDLHSTRSNHEQVALDGTTDCVARDAPPLSEKTTEGGKRALTHCTFTRTSMEVRRHCVAVESSTGDRRAVIVIATSLDLRKGQERLQTFSASVTLKKTKHQRSTYVVNCVSKTSPSRR